MCSINIHSCAWLVVYVAICCLISAHQAYSFYMLRFLIAFPFYLLRWDRITIIKDKRNKKLWHQNKEKYINHNRPTIHLFLVIIIIIISINFHPHQCHFCYRFGIFIVIAIPLCQTLKHTNLKWNIFRCCVSVIYLSVCTKRTTFQSQLSTFRFKFSTEHTLCENVNEDRTRKRRRNNSSSSSSNNCIEVISIPSIDLRIQLIWAFLWIQTQSTTYQSHNAMVLEKEKEIICLRKISKRIMHYEYILMIMW